MTIIIKTHFNSRMGKLEANKTSFSSIEETHYIVEEMLFVSVFPHHRFGAN
jgi:hypothetical protein